MRTERMGIAESLGHGPDRPLTRNQRRLVRSNRREVADYGGMGSGKSRGISIWGIHRSLLNPGCSVLMVSTSAEQHRDNLLGQILELLDTFGERQGYSLVRRYKRSPPYELILRVQRNGMADGRILFVGQDWLVRNRGSQFAAIALDEHPLYTHPERVYMNALGRLRAPRARFQQIVSAGNLDQGEVGILKKFTDRVKAGDPLVDLILSGTRENPVLGPEYIASLRATLTRVQFAAVVDGLIIRPTALYIPEFRRSKHLVAWSPAQSREHTWVVAMDWGLQSAILVALLVRFDVLGRVYRYDATGLSHLSVGLLVVDEVVDETLTTIEKVCHHVRNEVVPKWQRITGRDPYALVYDPAPGRAARQEVSRIAPESEARLWHYNQKDPDTKSAANRAQRLRAWLDPAEGPPRVLFAEELATRPSSLERGAVISLESLERDRVRGDYTSDMKPGTRFEHIVDDLGYAAQFADEDNGGGTYALRSLRDR